MTEEFEKLRKLNRLYTAYDTTQEWKQIVDEFINFAKEMMEKMETKKEKALFIKHLQKFTEILFRLPKSPTYLPDLPEGIRIQTPINPLIIKFGGYIKAVIGLQRESRSN